MELSKSFEDRIIMGKGRYPKPTDKIINRSSNNIIIDHSKILGKKDIIQMIKKRPSSRKRPFHYHKNSLPLPHSRRIFSQHYPNSLKHFYNRAKERYGIRWKENKFLRKFADQMKIKIRNHGTRKKNSRKNRRRFRGYKRLSTSSFSRKMSFNSRITSNNNYGNQSSISLAENTGLHSTFNSSSAGSQLRREKRENRDSSEIKEFDEFSRFGYVAQTRIDEIFEEFIEKYFGNKKKNLRILEEEEEVVIREVDFDDEKKYERKKEEFLMKIRRKGKIRYDSLLIKAKLQDSNFRRIMSMCGKESERYLNLNVNDLKLLGKKNLLKDFKRDKSSSWRSHDKRRKRRFVEGDKRRNRTMEESSRRNKSGRSSSNRNKKSYRSSYVTGDMKATLKKNQTFIGDVELDLGVNKNLKMDYHVENESTNLIRSTYFENIINGESFKNRTMLNRKNLLDFKHKENVAYVQLKEMTNERLNELINLKTVNYNRRGLTGRKTPMERLLEVRDQAREGIRDIERFKADFGHSLAMYEPNGEKSSSILVKKKAGLKNSESKNFGKKKHRMSRRISISSHINTSLDQRVEKKVKKSEKKGMNFSRISRGSTKGILNLKRYGTSESSAASKVVNFKKNHPEKKKLSFENEKFSSTEKLKKRTKYYFNGLQKKVKNLAAMAKMFKNVKKLQSDDLEQKILTIEKDRIFKAKIQSRVLTNLLKKHPIAATNHINLMRKESEEFRKKNYQSKKFMNCLKFFKVWEEYFENEANRMSIKCLKLFRDVLEYHRMLLFEGSTFIERDATNVYTFLEAKGMLMMDEDDSYREEEVMFLRILQSFYRELCILETLFIGLEDN